MEKLYQKMLWRMDDPKIYPLDEKGFGLDMPERLMWEAYANFWFHIDV